MPPLIKIRMTNPCRGERVLDLRKWPSECVGYLNFEDIIRKWRSPLVLVAIVHRKRGCLRGRIDIQPLGVLVAHRFVYTPVPG